VEEEEDGGFSKGEGGKRNLVLILFFFFLCWDARSSEKSLVIRRVTNESIFTSMNFLARVSLGSAVESGLLTQEYGYFHMLYREEGERVNKSCP
jgi:hypothetical protein